MKSGISAKSVAVLFVVVLALYLGAFYGIEYWTHRKGPWEVTFRSEASGTPSLVIYQPGLNISAVTLVFPDEKTARSNLSETVQFLLPVETLPSPLPLGEVIYEDLRALPGVVTFNFFGHEIELMPRVLVVNKKELPWKSGTTIQLLATNKLPQPPKPPKGWEKRS